MKKWLSKPFASDDLRATMEFGARAQEASAVREKNPDRVPVICQRSVSSSLAPVRKRKYLVPKSLTIAQFMYIVRRNMQLTPQQALFLFVGDTIAPAGVSIGELDEMRRDADGFLYVSYCEENTFGGAR